MDFAKNVSLLTLSLLSVLYSQSVYSMDPEASMDIFDAAKKGKLARVQELIAADPKIVNQQNLEYFVPLHFAAIYGDMTIVQALIKSGANVDQQDINGRTPLHWAVRQNHFEIVQELIAAGADLQAEDHYCQTPLQLAMPSYHNDYHGLTRMVDLLNDYQRRIEDAKRRAPQRVRIIAGTLALATQPRLGANSPVAYLPQELLRYLSKLSSDAELHDVRQPRPVPQPWRVIAWTVRDFLNDFNQLFFH